MSRSKADVLIVGGGVIGLCSAFYCTENGMSVELVERDRIPAGSSSGNAGLIVASHVSPLATPELLREGIRHLFDPYGPFTIKLRPDRELLSWLSKYFGYCNQKHAEKAVEAMVPFMARSRELHEKLASVGGGQYDYAGDGLLFLYSDQKNFRKGQQHASRMKKYGIESRFISGDSFRRMDGGFGENIAGAVEYPNDGRLNPASFVSWLADRLKTKSCRIHEETEVIGFETFDRKVNRVKTTKGDFAADAFVVCAGAWSSLLLRMLCVSLPLYGAKGYSVTFDLPESAPSVPLLLEEPRIAVTPYKDSFRIAGVLDLSGFDMAVDPKRIVNMENQVKNFLPGLNDLKVREIWRGLRPCAPDGLPVIGRAGNFKNLWVATGHATKGMSLGPSTGKMVADLLLGKSIGRQSVDFSLERFA